jgi:serine/threonine protein kinase
MLIQNKYEIIRFLGQGKFGQVFQGRRVKTQENVAIKLEPTEGIDGKLLKHETQILNYLAKSGCNIPKIYWYGVVEKYTCLVMTFFDKSLIDYLSENTGRDVLPRIMVQLIDILEHIHEKGVIHRDIKPDNVRILGDQAYIIDFGMATFFLDETGKHVPGKVGDNILGSPDYISYHIHCGNTPSRRDDLISLGYLYLFFLLGCKLPWFTNPMLVKRTSEVSSTNILHETNLTRKCEKSWEILGKVCMKHCPFITSYLEICYAYAYDWLPKYQELKKIFR